MTSMLSKVGFLLFLISSATANMPDVQDMPGTFSMDQYVEQSFKCFWHVICNLRESIKIKRAADQILAPQKEFVVNVVMPQIPEHLRLLTDVDEFDSDEIWENVYVEEACSWSKEDQDTFLTEVYGPFMEHFALICSDEEKTEECEGVNQANIKYHDMEAEMISREECEITPPEV